MVPWVSLQGAIVSLHGATVGLSHGDATILVAAALEAGYSHLYWYLRRWYIKFRFFERRCKGRYFICSGASEKEIIPIAISKMAMRNNAAL